jgi:hypothetical protein
MILNYKINILAMDQYYQLILNLSIKYLILMHLIMNKGYHKSQLGAVYLTLDGNKFMLLEKNKIKYLENENF